MTAVAGEAGTGAYALPLPAGWDDRTAVTLTGPMDDIGVSPSIVVTRERLCDHMGLGGFAEGWLNRLREEVPVDEARPAEHVEIAGRRAQIRTVSWGATGVLITQLVGLLVTDEEAYAVVCTASTASFPRYEDTFRRAITGFRLREDGPS